MSPSDDKQNKLSTLSQDVIAVGGRKTPAAPARTQERRAIPPAQDVFNVPVEPAPAARPAYGASPATPAPVMVPAAAGTPRAVWVAIVMAAVAIGIALYLAGTVTRQPAAVPLLADPQVAALREELRLAGERVQKLEQQVAAAPAATATAARPGVADSGNVLQLGAGLRELQNRLDALANEQQKLATQLADIRGQAAAAGKDGKAALQASQQLAVRVSALADVAGKPAAAGPAANAEAQAQLKALNQKTEKMATDIRQLYRLLETR